MSGKRLGWGLRLGWGRDWVVWSRQGLGRGLNLIENRDQAEVGCLVRAWPETRAGA